MEEKLKKPIYKKWWFIVIVGLFVIGALAGGEEEDQTKPGTDNTTAVVSDNVSGEDSVKDAEKEDDDVVKFGNGTYLVGKDIQSGLYKVKLTDTFSKMGYIERAKDLNMEMDSILANIILTGDGYVQIKDTDVAVKLQGVEITPIDLKSLQPNIKTEVSGGIYLVGYDIKPGTYKVEVTDEASGMGYVERAKNVSMGMDDIIANEIVQGQGYVNVKDSDFAIRVQGAKLTLQE